MGQMGLVAVKELTFKTLYHVAQETLVTSFDSFEHNLLFILKTLIIF